ncbi:hypothetical protein AMATHDRAFT_10140 [Amanita thiersii Skay4041]|uniref:Uncharacterized protein n=1 Tax=Amanita thiersii Skay4041 TaxID=703135 RepID=A0A2A9NBG2_9AGAR|nr:hypothetical protein AMATHDRAFT_10140 [Amanita thiersii Skay4041]
MDSEDHYQVTFHEYQRQWAQQQLEDWLWYNQAQQQVIQQAQQANQATTEFQAAQQANQANWSSQQVNQQYITQVPVGLPPISEEQHTQSPPITHLGEGHLSGRKLWMKLKVDISRLFVQHSNTTTKYLEDQFSSKKHSTTSTQQQSALERQVWELFCEELGLSPDSDEPLTDKQEAYWQQIRRRYITTRSPTLDEASLHSDRGS